MRNDCFHKRVDGILERWTLLSNKMGFIVPEVRLQSRLGSLFGAAKAALPV